MGREVRERIEQLREKMAERMDVHSIPTSDFHGSICERASMPEIYDSFYSTGGNSDHHDGVMDGCAAILRQGRAVRASGQETFYRSGRGRKRRNF